MWRIWEFLKSVFVSSLNSVLQNSLQQRHSLWAHWTQPARIHYTKGALLLWCSSRMVIYRSSEMYSYDYLNCFLSPFFQTLNNEFRCALLNFVQVMSWNKRWNFYILLTVHDVMIFDEWPTWCTNSLLCVYVYLQLSTCFEHTVLIIRVRDKLFQYSLW